MHNFVPAISYSANILSIICVARILETWVSYHTFEVYFTISILLIVFSVSARVAPLPLVFSVLFVLVPLSIDSFHCIVGGWCRKPQWIQWTREPYYPIICDIPVVSIRAISPTPVLVATISHGWIEFNSPQTFQNDILKNVKVRKLIITDVFLAVPVIKINRVWEWHGESMKTKCKLLWNIIPSSPRISS